MKKTFLLLKGTSRSNELAFIAILAFIFPLAAIYARQIHAPCDDAYIFLVYAKNFIEGNGLTFNGARVEGFSSILWVALLSVLGLTGFPLPQIAETLSMLSGLFALLATYKIGRKCSLSPAWALLPVTVLAFTGDFAYYMSVGLEQVLFTGLVALCVAYAAFYVGSGNYYILPLLMTLMILARPEGALIAFLLLLIIGISRRSPDVPVRFGLAIALLLAPVLAAGRIYYGYFLPNTYYAKSNAGIQNLHLGIQYLVDAAPRYSVILLLTMICAFPALHKRNRRATEDILPLCLIVVVWILYVAIQGGDNMVGGRNLLVVLPLLYVALARLASEASLKIAIPLAVLVCLALVLNYQMDAQVAMHSCEWRRSAEFRRKAGLYLKANFRPSTLVALNPAGIIPFYSGMPTIDMLGLNDTHIAHYGKRDRNLRYGHQAGSGAYVLARKPDVILFGSCAGRFASDFISDREIWESDEFRNEYAAEIWPGIGYAYVRKPGIKRNVGLLDTLPSAKQ